MLSIRLKPIGKKKQISYRIVVVEKRSKLTGKFIEDLGFYNPHSKDLNFKSDRVKYWLGVGAQPSDTVHNLMIKSGMIEGDKRKKRIRPSKEKDKEEKKEGEKTEEREEEKGEEVEKKEEEKKEEEKDEEKKEEEEKEKDKIEEKTEEIKEEKQEEIEKEETKEETKTEENNISSEKE
jgi:small subunit ribosomal protein S16